ncbi:hypothetical protein [Reticulibacter mediterranei]|uniref:hypothetical protein n=1 Tax=Reticulibacter mediterranei TaxID=2778369 RepID=UPI001C68FF5F|nr:hypothetical protein [Reticulibacter mediterranei]
MIELFQMWVLVEVLVACSCHSLWPLPSWRMASSYHGKTEHVLSGFTLSGGKPYETE